MGHTKAEALIALLVAAASLLLPGAAVAGGSNVCPTASGASIAVDVDSQVNSNLMASDADGDALIYIITQPPAHGTLVVQAQTGAFSYSPSPGYCGPDSFKFKANDGQCDSNEATVSITVCPMTPTPTSTPTPTPTPTPVPQGGNCTDPAECAAGLFCVHTFCCDRPCDSSFERCDVFGREGTCTALATAAPVASGSGLTSMVGLLLAIGIFGVLRTRRPHRR
jgi:hypothetical protein